MPWAVKRFGLKKSLMAKGFSSTSEAENFDSFQGSLCHLPLYDICRKAKDYTYLYGNSFDDAESSLTRHLKSTFVEGCEEYITRLHEWIYDQSQGDSGWRNDRMGPD